jgi:hypothetical protein
MLTSVVLFLIAAFLAWWAASKFVFKSAAF